jgi:hypothetical protein
MIWQLMSKPIQFRDVSLTTFPEMLVSETDLDFTPDVLGFDIATNINRK